MTKRTDLIYGNAGTIEAQLAELGQRYLEEIEANERAQTHSSGDEDPEGTALLLQYGPMLVRRLNEPKPTQEALVAAKCLWSEYLHKKAAHLVKRLRPLNLVQARAIQATSGDSRMRKVLLSAGGPSGQRALRKRMAGGTR